METIRAIIVEDEPKNVDILTNILEKYCQDVEVVGVANSVREGVKLINSTPPDVLFLDIEMPPQKGFEVLEMLPTINFDVIFITAYQEYALQAIKFAALDYLLKPLKVSEVKTALEKVRKHRQNSSHGAGPNELATVLKDYLKSKDNNFSKIVIPVNDGYNVVDLKEILYCEALDSYTKIQLTRNTNHVISKSLKEYEEMLGDKGFFRVHKSFLINMHHITKIIKGLGAAVIMSDQMNIPISSRKKEEFFNKLKEFMNI